MIAMLNKPVFTNADFEPYLQSELSLVYGIPGSGKTELACQLAHAASRAGLRVMIATISTWQSLDISRKLSINGTQTPIYLLHKKKKPLPKELFVTKGITATTKLPSQIPPSISIATGQKWAWLKEDRPKFDLMIVDEAHQMPYMLFLQLQGLSERAVLISDLNLLRPIITTSTDRWENMPDGPHTPVAAALAHQNKADFTQLLSCSYRLHEEDIHRLSLKLPSHQSPRAHQSTSKQNLNTKHAVNHPAVNALLDGQSIVQCELSGNQIEDYAHQIQSILTALLEAQICIEGGRMSGPLNPAKCAVICASTTECTQLERLIGSSFPEVLIETTDGIQGQERAITIVLHPLHSSSCLTPFTLDYGRFVTMMSRHRVGCILLSPSNLHELLYKHPQLSTSILEHDQSTTMDWIQHLNFLTWE